MRPVTSVQVAEQAAVGLTATPLTCADSAALLRVLFWPPERPTAIKGTMNHAKTSFSTEICAGAIMSVVQSLAPLRHCSD
jgi:hypothetical protein